MQAGEPGPPSARVWTAAVPGLERVGQRSAYELLQPRFRQCLASTLGEVMPVGGDLEEPHEVEPVAATTDAVVEELSKVFLVALPEKALADGVADILRAAFLNVEVPAGTVK